MNIFKSRQKEGFTVIEILVTIAIIGILGSYIMPRVKDAKTKGEVAKAQAQLRQIANAIEILGGETEEWPGHQVAGGVDTGASNNEIWDLTTAAAGLTQTDGAYSNWDGPYIPEVFTDPWGNNYFFDTDYNVGTSTPIWAAVVGSFGPNGNGQNVYDSDNVYIVLENE